MQTLHPHMETYISTSPEGISIVPSDPTSTLPDAPVPFTRTWTTRALRASPRVGSTIPNRLVALKRPAGKPLVQLEPLVRLVPFDSKLGIILWDGRQAFITNVDKMAHELDKDGRMMGSVGEILSKYFPQYPVRLSGNSAAFLDLFREVLGKDGQYWCINRRVHAVVLFLVQCQVDGELQSSQETSEWFETRLRSAYAIYEFRFLHPETLSSRREGEPSGGQEMGRQEQPLALSQIERQRQLAQFPGNSFHNDLHRTTINKDSGTSFNPQYGPPDASAHYTRSSFS